MIIKAHRYKENYSIVSNAPFRDARLSFKARGLLAYLFTHNKKWEVHIRDLVSNSPGGKESVQNGMKELRKFGYAAIETHQNEKTGKMEGRMWVIYEDPNDNISYQNGHHQTEEPLTGKPIGRTTPPINNKQKTKEITSATAPRGADLSAEFGKVTSNFPDTKSGKLCQLFEQFTIQNKLNWVITNKGIRARVKINRQLWNKACESLLEVESYANVCETLEWFFLHHADIWVPKCASMVTFCQSFQKIQRGMYRDQNRKPIQEDETQKLVEAADRLAQQYRKK